MNLPIRTPLNKPLREPLDQWEGWRGGVQQYPPGWQHPKLQPCSCPPPTHFCTPVCGSWRHVRPNKGASDPQVAAPEGDSGGLTHPWPQCLSRYP